MTWWMGPFAAQRGRFDPEHFNFLGIVPIAYTLFAAALLLAVGTISRRTVPTLVSALVVFLPIRLGIETKLRPHFRAPLSVVGDADIQTSQFTSIAGPHDWVVDRGLVDALGHHLSALGMMALCPPTVEVTRRAQAGPVDCFTAHGLRMFEEYQPAGRFWQFQLIETAIYLGLAAGLIALTVWWITRRLA